MGGRLPRGGQGMAPSPGTAWASRPSAVRETPFRSAMISSTWSVKPVRQPPGDLHRLGVVADHMCHELPRLHVSEFRCSSGEVPVNGPRGRERRTGGPTPKSASTVRRSRRPESAHGEESPRRPGGAPPCPDRCGRGLRSGSSVRGGPPARARRGRGRAGAAGARSRAARARPGPVRRARPHPGLAAPRGRRERRSSGAQPPRSKNSGSGDGPGAVVTRRRRARARPGRRSRGRRWCWPGGRSRPARRGRGGTARRCAATGRRRP